MTWDLKRLKRTPKAEEEQRDISEEETVSDNDDQMATHQFGEMLFNLDPGPRSPSLLEREEYETQGLLHPADLPEIRQRMHRGVVAHTGFSPKAGVWPVDMSDEELEKYFDASVVSS